jgi:hypothetical protein
MDVRGQLGGLASLVRHRHCRRLSLQPSRPVFQRSNERGSRLGEEAAEKWEERGRAEAVSVCTVHW